MNQELAKEIMEMFFKVANKLRKTVADVRTICKSEYESGHRQNTITHHKVKKYTDQRTKQERRAANCKVL